MAAPMEGPASLSDSSSSDENDTPQNEQITGELDFSSANFNPLKALFSPDVIVPYENVKSFSSVHCYEQALTKKSNKGRGNVNPPACKPSTSGILSQSQGDEIKKGQNQIQNVEKTVKCHSKSKEEATTSSRSVSREFTDKAKVQFPLQSQTQTSVGNSPEVSHDSSEKDKRAKCQYPQTSVRNSPEVSHDSSEKDKEQSEKKNIATSEKTKNKRHDDKSLRNVFTRMADTSGPLALLSRCVNERLHVRVMTRAAVTVRSICRGYIVAFDKTFNMAMIDVDEIYRRPVCLGKIRARRTYKLKQAHNTLKKEREEQQQKFVLDDIIPSNKKIQFVNKGREGDETEQKADTTNKETIGEETETIMEHFTQEKQVVNKNNNDLSQKTQSVEATQISHRASVYENVPFPFSFYEREALMLGIPDENVEHRHVNQLFIRGENVVLVSIIDE